MMLLLGLLAGPFGAIFMAIGALFLVVPAAVILVVAARVMRDRKYATGPVAAVMILGWSLALGCGALIGSIASPGVPSSMNLGVAPILFWLALLSPFALAGAVIATTWTLVRKARIEPRGALR
ncbi:hypothetical protein [Microbacterium invictum]|uniref:Uncharacterized protein n=1 Tax=Microbacterium invictum TaxID=515415 RepID=A0ABZ0VA71_9MICO|nr:hypothetical protein [Microbacterium invictum]WQB70510.1 hypothetical protein T9R20_00690 [Microbacterium invictum]